VIKKCFATINTFGYCICDVGYSVMLSVSRVQEDIAVDMIVCGMDIFKETGVPEELVP
jgi:hypothetical protein